MTRKSFLTTLLAGPLALLAAIGLVKRKPVVLCYDHTIAVLRHPDWFCPNVVSEVRRILRSKNYVFFDHFTGKTYPPMWCMERTFELAFKLTKTPRKFYTAP